ncbi:DUF3040 domain-containing protein [Nakamurella flavida]|uniref:DUF3040 domain-containing protein n=1 Tax=Nakamurella flavida TaxID=363630 RepID=A0A938YKW8_9ACTN|nr:DUF3040 domain-containing protein [Nakamurella flavida]MBM9475159.1 DUF3040 domain-containing protein [Nakamurella flavida]MDP9776730.1 hypothetical protein [Nakamurella flavida]
MPLSEDDQRALAQIELALSQDDPAFSSSIADKRFQRLQRRRILIPVLLFGVGAVLLVAGLVITDALLGVGLGVVFGALLMLASAAALFYRHRHQVLFRTSSEPAADRKLL